MPPSNLLLASKIVITEEPPQIRNITGAPTAIMGFVGVTERGPVRVPQFVTSFEEFVQTFGSFIAESDLPIAVEAFFRNGGTAAWITRVVHYTDITNSATSTAVKGDQTLKDRGGAAAAATLDSAAGPFSLDDGEDLVVDIDNTGPDILTISASPATSVSGAETYALSDGERLYYQVKQPGSASLDELRFIEFNTAEFAAIGAATAEEVAAVINSEGVGISADVTGGGTTVTIKTDKIGSDAELVIDASTTATALGFGVGTTNGAGNVLDAFAVTAAELAALLTALPLSAGTAVAVGDVLRLTGVTTGPVGEVEITGATTAVGIFAGVLPITVNGVAALEVDTIQVIAKTEGTWIEDYSIAIEDPSSGDADRFNLRVKKGTATVEVWPNLTLDDTDPRYVEDFINANSIYIDIVDLLSATAPNNNLPKLGEFSAWANQDDGLTGLVDADYTGSQAGGTGLFALDQVSQITVLLVPGRATSAVHNAMLSYCEVDRAGTCFAILDPPENLDEQGIKTYVESTAAIGGLSEFGAIYWPRVKILNPSTAIFGTTEDGNIVVPPSGHIAGVYARTDASRPGGVYEPPAGVEVGRLFGVLGFETDDVLDERKRDVVFPARINPLTSIDGSPRHIDGARTLKGDDNFPTVAERRGVIFIEVSLKSGLLFAKHRNNDARLRKQIKNTIDTFLLTQFDVQAFRGATPSESFFTDVSDALNPTSEIFAGRLNARIGVATQKPAEFIILKFTQDTRALEERLADEGLAT